MGNVSVYLGGLLIDELDRAAAEHHFKNRSSLVKSAVEEKIHYLRAQPIKCMECGQPIKKPELGMVSWFKNAHNRFSAFAVHHKGKCDRERENRFGKIGCQYWDELAEVSNPKGYMRFVFDCLGYWNAGYVLQDSDGLIQVLDRISKFVLRKASGKEQEVWEQSSHPFTRVKDVSRRARPQKGLLSDPFAKVIGIGGDGTLSQNMDEELYGESSK